MEVECNCGVSAGVRTDHEGECASSYMNQLKRNSMTAAEEAAEEAAEDAAEDAVASAKEPDPPTPEEVIKRSRGAQLRALILSWHLNETYQNTLQLQATELQKGTLEISEDWGSMANSILHSFEDQIAPKE